MAQTDSPAASPPNLAARRQEAELGWPKSSLGGWGLTIATLLWTGLTGAWLFVAVHVGPGIVVLLVSTCLVLIGCALIVATIKDVLTWSKLRSPRIIVSVQPLYVGEWFSGRFVQTARSAVRIERVTVRLVCREQATAGRGNNVTSVAHEVFTRQVSFAEAFPADARHPIAGEFRFRIPKDAMHSFWGKHNQILWLLTTHTAVDGWPDDKAEFAVEVIPRRANPTQGRRRRSR